MSVVANPAPAGQARRSPGRLRPRQLLRLAGAPPAPAMPLGQPTLLLKPPEQITGTRGLPFYLFTCNDGGIYRITALAALKGLKAETLRHRLKDHPWWEPDILYTKEEALAAKKQKTAQRQAAARLAKEAARLAQLADGGNSEWARLGQKTRPQNFRRLKPWGSWEQQQEDRRHGR